MHDDKDKKIGSATYLKKNSGLYIPFQIKMDGTSCKQIQPMLDLTQQLIGFKDKKNKT